MGHLTGEIFFFKISRLSMSSKSSLSLCPTKHKNDFTKNMNSVPMCYGKPGGKGIKFLLEFGEPLVWGLSNVLRQPIFSVYRGHFPILQTVSNMFWVFSLFVLRTAFVTKNVLLVISHTNQCIGLAHIFAFEGSISQFE